MGVVDCGEVRRELTAYARKELDAPTRRRVVAHLEGCLFCREELDAILDTLSITRSSFGSPEGERSTPVSEPPMSASNDFRSALFKRLHRIKKAEDRAKAIERTRRFRSLKLSEELACAMAFVRYRIGSSSHVRLHLSAFAALVVLIIAVPVILRSVRQKPTHDVPPHLPAEVAESTVVSRGDTPNLEIPSLAEAEALRRRLEFPGGASTLDDEPLLEIEAPTRQAVLDDENSFLTSRLSMIGRWDRHQRDHWLNRRGGGSTTEYAVNRGLMWLAREQVRDGGDDGYWPPELVGGAHGLSGADSRATVGLAALGVLAFVSDGHSKRSGRYHSVVDRGLSYLMRHQDQHATFGAVDEKSLRRFNHATSCLALVEHYVLCGGDVDESMEGAMIRGLGRLVDQQEEVALEDQEDPCVGHQMAWTALALATAYHAGIAVESLEGAAIDAGRYLDHLAEESWVESGNATALAHAALETVIDIGPSASWNDRVRTNPRTQEYLEVLADAKRAEPAIVFFATTALQRRGGKDWAAFNKDLKQRLTAMQSADGYWQPEFDWECSPGGDVYATALSLMALQVYYRFLSPEEALGKTSKGR